MNQRYSDEPLIDFAELVSSVPGEGLEGLVRLLARRRQLSPVWSGRGADRGRDLLFTETLSGPLVQEKITWLVSCKDKAKSGESVGERDLPSPGIRDKLGQHEANGFLLVTTTTVSTAAKSLLDSLDRSIDARIYTLVWDSTDLTQMLLDPSNEDLLKQFLPKSYQRVKGLTSLEGAVLAFREQLPEGVLAEVMQLVSPYSTSASQGTVIWPYDAGAAAVIDEVLTKLTVEDDPEGAAATDQIDYDAFVALVNTLVIERYDQCRGYLLAIVHYHFEPDIRFNAAQLLFDHYELSSAEMLEVATHLDSSALEEFYSSEIISFVIEELYNNTDSYGLNRVLDELPGWTRVEEIYIEKISFDVRSEVRQVRFDGTMDLSLAFVFDGEEMGEHSFSGVFSGYFDEHGIYLDDASIDTNSYYGHTEDGSE